MQRNLRRLSDTTFDLIVIGAGIYGATIAWDAALRGLSVAIIDRADFGSGTSFNSLKTIHGGVRELQSGNVFALRQFVRERRSLSRIAPHLIRPLPFIMPTYGHLSRHRKVLQLGFALNDLLAFDRNFHTDPSQQLPPSRLLSREECLLLNPLIDPDGVTGGIEWHDCQMRNSDRLNLSFIVSAVMQGAVAANYVECIGALKHGQRIEGISVHDRLNGARFDVRGRVVVNGAGPWSVELLKTLVPDFKHTVPQGFSRAMNVLFSNPMEGKHALGGTVSSRLLFAVPWRGFTLVGTSHDSFNGSTAGFCPTRAHIESFLRDINIAFPNLNITADNVRLLHRGLLPTDSANDNAIKLLKQSPVVDHRANGVDGLLSVLGVRYTTARHTAQKAVDVVFSLLGRRSPTCKTDTTPLVGADFDNLTDFLRSTERRETAGVRKETQKRLALSYGTKHDQLLNAISTHLTDRMELSSACQITRAEIRHAVTSEMAVHLTDAMLRRTEAGSAGHPGDDALRAAASIMSEELNWSPTRTEEEIIDAQHAYFIPSV